LLENPLKLYRDCVRLADFLAHKQGWPRDALRATVREPWRRHMGETDPEKVVKLREGAIRGLSNYMMCVTMEVCETVRLTGGDARRYEASRGAMEGAPVFAPDDGERAPDDGNAKGSGV